MLFKSLVVIMFATIAMAYGRTQFNELSNNYTFTEMVINKERLQESKAGQYWGIYNLYAIVSDRSYNQDNFWNAYPHFNYFLSQDFNEGAKGKFIYLAGNMGWSDIPVRSLLGASSSKGSHNQVASYRNINNNKNLGWPGIDFNNGAGGDYVYLWESVLEHMGQPITRLGSIVTNYANPRPPDRYTRVGVDFNKGCGSGTPYIYLVYATF